jgi:hypothetical protein
MGPSRPSGVRVCSSSLVFLLHVEEGREERWEGCLSKKASQITSNQAFRQIKDLRIQLNPVMVKITYANKRFVAFASVKFALTARLTALEGDAVTT